MTVKRGVRFLGRIPLFSTIIDLNLRLSCRTLCKLGITIIEKVKKSYRFTLA